MPVFNQSQIVAAGNYIRLPMHRNAAAPTATQTRGPTGLVRADVTAKRLHFDPTCHGNRTVTRRTFSPQISPSRSPAQDVRSCPPSLPGPSRLSTLFRGGSHRPDTGRGDRVGDAAAQPVGSTHRRTPALHSVGIACDKCHFPSASASFTVRGPDPVKV